MHLRPKRRRPYCSDRNGNSTTRAFVLAFLEQWASPTYETYPSSTGKKYTLVGRGIYDQVYNRTNYPTVPLYTENSSPATSPRIGRAARSPSGGNSEEFLWACIADVCMAVQTLTQQQRQMLSYKYVDDLSEYEFCKDLGRSVRFVRAEIDRAINQIVEVLDGTFTYP